MSKRLRFFSAHLGISILVLSLVATLVFTQWYPQPLATITGVAHVFLLLMGIDVILGPVCSFLVYKEGKKSLKFDLTVIILIQLSAFGYGFYSVATARPVWIVFYDKGFDLIRANEIDREHLKEAAPDFSSMPLLGARYAAAFPASDEQGFGRDMYEESMGYSVSQKPARYVPLSQAAKQMRAAAKDMSILYNYNRKDIVDAELKQYPDADAWLPLKRGLEERVVLINKEKAEALHIVDLKTSLL